MAKALFGHVTTTHDQRLVAEVRRLRGRVRELETELADLRTSVSVTDDDLRLLTLDERVDAPAFS